MRGTPPGSAVKLDRPVNYINNLVGFTALQ